MESLELLEKLISFPTVSRDSNLELINFIRDFLATHGIRSQLYVDASGVKANLFATIGPVERRGVLLSGHTDVVPVDGQVWTSDPFTMTRRNGRAYGRGTADMKGFIACALAAARRATHLPLAAPLQLAFSYDEEVGCLGVRSLIDAMAGWAVRPRFCVVGEPTLLRTATGHKGKTALTCVCRGHAAHSANPHRGINAIHLATDMIARLRERQDDIGQHGARDSAYDVPYTSLHVGMIRGGTALNIVPDHCELALEIRNLAADAPSSIVDGLREDAARIVGRSRRNDLPAGRIDIEITNEYPGLDTPVDHELVSFVAELTGSPSTIKVGFGTEGGLFSERLNIPTIVCGPGSIDQAHKPDEFIDIDQLCQCDAVLDSLLARLGSMN